MATTAQKRPPSRWQEIRSSTRYQKTVRSIISYTILCIGAAFVLFPMLWMISSSMKPSWQIFTSPPIWIPQEWESVTAGNTNRQILLYRVQRDGETENVIQIGSRRYTTAIDAARLTDLQSVPSDQLGTATSTVIDGITFNVRSWTTDGQTQDVVALARGEGDNLLVAPVSVLQTAALRMPLDEVNSGGRVTLEIDGAEFRGREIETEDGTLSVIPIGPETDLVVVGPPESVANARLVPAELVSSAGTAVIGETELPLSIVEGSDEEYIVLATDSWQPIINEDELDAYAFVADRAALGERSQRDVNGVSVQVTQYTPEGGTPQTVVILVSGTQNSLVIPVDDAATLRLAQYADMTTTRGDTMDRIPYRVQDGYSEGDVTSSVALIGDPRNMALIVPADAVNDAFDVAPANLERALHTEFTFDSYREALTTKVGGTYFPTFFRNSFVLVILNTIGHVISCIVVAYAFARLRAPGKNFLFLVLLGTMMLPFPVTLVPMYEIFRDLNMVNTLWPLFIRSFFGNAFLIFMMRQFFSSIPKELEEAARIDGASTLRIIWNVFVPLSKPAIATVIIFTFWWTWNSFLEPLIYLSSPDMFPVSLGLNFFQDQYGTSIYFDRLIAASVLSMLPMLILFFFAQRYFIDGIQMTGMK
ncbi:MAG: binding-protein-dependent transport system inner membrane protein [Chloroflexi bacterium OLB15]|nr:MAG: binding-protein-dependent transport system inner membrane protein [Chloroflexi bacterium OLB15]